MRWKAEVMKASVKTSQGRAREANISSDGAQRGRGRDGKWD